MYISQGNVFISDFITVLTTASGADLGKSFSGPNLEPLPFQTSKHFTSEELELHDLLSLIDVLQSLEGEPTKTAIRGNVPSDESEIISRDKATILASPRSWCMIDIDGLFWDGPNDHEAMLNHAISHLPAEFQNTDCYYHFSSSMGIKDGIRVHLWYWLDRSCSDEEMSVWLSGSAADPRMYNPIQIHLTANPRFVNGAVDPVAKRSGVMASGRHQQAISSNPCAAANNDPAAFVPAAQCAVQRPKTLPILDCVHPHINERLHLIEK